MNRGFATLILSIENINTRGKFQSLIMDFPKVFNI